MTRTAGYRYAVSRGTVRQAFAAPRADGVIAFRRGARRIDAIGATEQEARWLGVAAAFSVRNSVAVNAVSCVPASVFRPLRWPNARPCLHFPASCCYQNGT
jgi:DNA-binding GntR family transcriptional regulator